ncbi:hypothetical protein IV203_024060 [Nitzschia inconspicua]|uniref:Uncharacterized protein n=1 Tax=Nitzschia inconspicua TaxID=303405 RepID=A0A9K3KB63_9STRA|nr:hypothetical protein IV203_024060 [Nitzschia inconspicua]
MGCMTDLSTDEVIMNNQVKAVEDSDFPNMHLVVLDERGNHMESPFHYSNGDHDKELSIAFVNPYSPEEFSEDIQFVMEVDGPASFLEGGTIGCDGDKRVAARWTDNDGKVVLKLNDGTATVTVWAGWATGQNAVRLTPKLIIGPADAKPPAETEQNPEQQQQQPAQPKEVQEFPTPDANDVIEPLQNLLTKKEVPEELQNIDHDGRPGHHHIKQKIVDRENSLSGGGSRSSSGGGGGGGVGTAHRDMIAQKHKEHTYDLAAAADKVKKLHAGRSPPHNADDNDHHHQAALDRQRQKSVQQMKKHRSIIEGQMSKNFETAANKNVNASSHLMGCIFFVLCLGGFLFAFGKKRDKGRRDL